MSTRIMSTLIISCDKAHMPARDNYF